MALITGSNTLDTDFTPTAKVFTVRVTGANEYDVELLSKADAGDNFEVSGTIKAGAHRIVDNPVVGTIYRFRSVRAVVRADE